MKKLLLTFSVVMLFVCLLAISVSAANQSYSTFDVTLTDGTQKTAYTAGLDQWEGRIYLNVKLYAEAPVDTEGTYEEIDWTTVKEIDFSNAMLYVLNNGTYTEKAYGSNQNNTALCIYPNGLDRKNQLTSLEKVTTGKVVTLREGAFNGAPAIKTLVISSSLKYIQNNVFYNCTTLEEIIFEEGSQLETVNDSFLGCTSLKSLNLPASIKTLGNNAFNGCTGLESVSFAPGGSCTLKTSVFEGCKSLKNIDLSDTVKDLGGNTFKNCDSIVSFTVPDTVTSIGGYIFAECDNLEELIFSENSPVNSKLIGVIMSCPKVTSFRIPPLVTEMGYDNFWNCKALTEVIWPNNLTAITGGNNWNNCTSLKSIAFPNTLTTMNGGQFSNCTALEEIRLGSSLTNIGSGLFNLKGIKRIYIPATITSVGTNILGYSNPADSSQNITFIFTGTKEQAEVVRALALASTEGTNHQPNASKFYDATLVSASEYDVTQEPSGYHFVYDYNVCDAFYEGKHTMTGNAEMKLDSYFNKIIFADTCTRQGCGNAVIDESKTIGAIFVDYGYSCTEEKINGSYSVSQFFGINQDALADYILATGNTVEYGLVVSTVNNPLAEENSGLIAQGKTYVTTQSKFAHDYFAINVIGITDGEEGTKDTRENMLTFCAYVIDNGKVYYLDGGKTLEAAAQNSYANVLGTQE